MLLKFDILEDRDETKYRLVTRWVRTVAVARLAIDQHSELNTSILFFHRYSLF